jgi:hypothetical protein
MQDSNEEEKKPISESNGQPGNSACSALESDEICPVCGKGHMAYDGFLILTVRECGYQLGRAADSPDRNFIAPVLGHLSWFYIIMKFEMITISRGIIGREINLETSQAFTGIADTGVEDTDGYSSEHAARVKARRPWN